MVLLLKCWVKWGIVHGSHFSFRTHRRTEASWGFSWTCIIKSHTTQIVVSRMTHVRAEWQTDLVPGEWRVNVVSNTLEPSMLLVWVRWKTGRGIDDVTSLIIHSLCHTACSSHWPCCHRLPHSFIINVHRLMEEQQYEASLNGERLL